MKYEDLKNKDNFHYVSTKDGKVYFDKYTDAIDFAEKNGKNQFVSFWKDEMGYSHETYHSF